MLGNGLRKMAVAPSPLWGLYLEPWASGTIDRRRLGSQANGILQLPADVTANAANHLDK